MSEDLKYDKGKILAGIIFQDFPLALKAVSEIATFGANKYKRSSWKTVPNALERYTDAKFRHILEGQTFERDDESGLLHAAHEAWNALATLQLKLEQQKPEKEDPMFIKGYDAGLNDKRLENRAKFEVAQAMDLTGTVAPVRTV